MAKRVMTVNSVIVYDDKRGEYRQFYAGDEFDDHDEDVEHLLPLLGDHLFKEVEEASDDVPDLEQMKVPQLVEMCKELGLSPRSSKKQDLINAIRAFEEESGGAEEE